MRHILIRNLVQQVIHTVQPRPLLVVAFDDVPRRFGNVGSGEGLFLGLGIGLPAHA
ncbi:hypothetical protein D3C71_2191570 [compost metagenome]